MSMFNVSKHRLPMKFRVGRLAAGENTSYMQSLSLHESLAVACNPLLEFMVAFVMQSALKDRDMNKQNYTSIKPTSK